MKETNCSKMRVDPNLELQEIFRKEVRCPFRQLTLEEREIRSRSIKRLEHLMESLQLPELIFSSAITYFDLVVSKVSSDSTSYQEIVLICLLIACKYHESSDIADKSEKVLKILETEVGEKLMKALELRVLTLLQWNIDIQTPIQFVEYYIDRGKHQY